MTIDSGSSACAIRFSRIASLRRPVWPRKALYSICPVKQLGLKSRARVEELSACSQSQSCHAAAPAKAVQASARFASSSSALCAVALALGCDNVVGAALRSPRLAGGLYCADVLRVL